MAPKIGSAEAAKRTGLPDPHIRKMAREGRIPHYRIAGPGGGWIYRFDPDELDRWLADAHVVPA